MAMNAIFRVVTRIQDQDDFSGNLTDGEFLRYNSSTNDFELQAVSPGGDSGQLQYNDNGTFAGVDHSSIGISGDIFKLSSLAIGDVPLILKGFTGQTGNLTEWRNNSDTVLAKIDAGGSFTCGTITASGLLNLQNSTTPTEFNLHNTYTSATSREYLKAIAVTGGAYQIGSAIGSAGGSNRAINLGHSDSAGTFTSYFTVETNGNVGVGVGSTTPVSRFHIVDATTSILTVQATGETTGDKAWLQFKTANTDTGVHFRKAGICFERGSVGNSRGTLYICNNNAGSSAQVTVSDAAITISNSRDITLTQGVSASGSPVALTVTGAAHTTLNTAEVTDGYFNAARTVNFGATGGTVANQRTWRFTAPTFTAAAATTITNLSTVTISGAPTASTNVTATNSYALNVESGAAYFGGSIRVVGQPTLATSGGVVYIYNSSYEIAANGAGISLGCSGVAINAMGTYGCMLPAGRVLAWSSEGNPSNSSSAVLELACDAANIFHQRRSTNAQTFRLAETWTSSTSFGALQIKANTGAAYQIGSAIGSAGGTNRAINFGHYDSAGTFTVGLSVETGGYALSPRFCPTASDNYGNGLYSLHASGLTYSAHSHYLYSHGFWTGYTYITCFELNNAREITSGTDMVRINANLYSAGTGGNLLRVNNRQTAGLGNLLQLTNNETEVFSVNNFGNTLITQRVYTSGSPTALTVTGAAHTTLTTAEVTDGYFNAARTVNFGATGGTIASQRTWRFTAPTFTAAAATTITNLSTVTISGAPTASTNVTATNSYALNVESGRIGFTGGANTGGIYFAGAGAYYAPHIASSSDLYIQSPAKFNWIFSGTQYMEFYNGIISTVNFIHLGGATYGAGDVNLTRDAARIFAVRDSTNANVFRLYNTYTSSTSGEWAEFNWQTTTNVLRMGTGKGSAGGSARDIAIVHGGTVVANFLSDRFYLGPITDGTTTGGNARGQYAVDLQLNRTTNAKVASGTYSTILGGYANTASGTYSSVTGGANNVASGGNSATVTGGNANTASQSFSRAGGFYAVADQYGMDVWSGGGFANFGSSSDTRVYRHMCKQKTVDATPVRLQTNGINETATYTYISSGRVLLAMVKINGVKSDGSACAEYVRKVSIKNVGGTTSLVGVVETIGNDIEDDPLTDVTITADDINDALDISVTGIAGETWRWVAVVEGLEIAYGT